MRDFERTINRVLNLETKTFINANEFFQKDEKIIFEYRTQCQLAIQRKRDPLLVCDTCGQLIQISGGKGGIGKILHFKHLKDSEDCPNKTDSKLSQLDILRGKFNGQVEGKLHIETKNLIASFLQKNKDSNKGITEVNIEKIERSQLNYKIWKKPDVSSIYLNKKLVFEIQLSTTFLNVIVERETFYKDNNTFILWVFRNFDIEEDKQRFTQKDIFYSNNRNAFVLDKKSIQLSNDSSDLILACHYQNPVILNNKICYEWKIDYVSLDQLTFDIQKFQVYYFDVFQAEENLQVLLKEKIEELEKQKIKNDLDKLIDSIRLNSPVDPIQIHRNNIVLDQLKYEKDNLDYFYRVSKIDPKSKLLKLVCEKKSNYLPDLIELFKKGYEPTNEDKLFINNEFKYLNNLKTHHSRDSPLYQIIIITMMIKLRHHRSYIENFRRYERVLTSIYCLKEKKLIGYNYKSLIQLIYPIIRDPSRDQFYKVIIRAIEDYYGYKKFLNDFDKSDKLKNKVKQMQFPEVSDYNKTLFKLIFKELKL